MDAATEKQSASASNGAGDDFGMKGDSPQIYSYDAAYFTSGISGWHRTSFPAIANAYDQAVGSEPVESLLDFGCGDGFYGPFLSQRTKILDGVDYSDAAKQARFASVYRNLYQADLGLPWHHADDQSYDLLFSTEVVEHVQNYDMFFENAYRMLKPGGQLVLTTTTYAFTIFVMLVAYRRKVSVKSLAEYIRGYWNYSSRSAFVERFSDYFCGHHHGFTKGQLRKSLTAAGFHVERLDYLFAQDVVHLQHLNQPYNGRYKLLVTTALPVLRFGGRLINSVCRRTKIYAPNVILVARKPT